LVDDHNRVLYCPRSLLRGIYCKLHVTNFIIKSQPTLIPNLFEGAVLPQLNFLQYLLSLLNFAYHYRSLSFRSSFQMNFSRIISIFSFSLAFYSLRPSILAYLFFYTLQNFYLWLVTSIHWILSVSGKKFHTFNVVSLT
jgi:hypothetical protein